MKRLCFTFLAAAVAVPAHASPLTRAYVYQVASASAGSELVVGQTTTKKDHGGAWMRIVTDDIGYGRNAQARLLSNSLREISKEPLCNAGGRVELCRRGQTVIGYRRTWDASGHQGGNFEYVVYPSSSGSVARATFQVQ